MSTIDSNRLSQVLSDNGYSLTKARNLIFKSLISPEPQPMNNIISKLKGRVDRVSVYRNIELFEKLGIVHRIYIGWKYKIELSDKFLAHHHHINCLGCGNSIDIEDEAHIDEFIESVTKKHNFTVRRHQFEIDGYCSVCIVNSS